MGDNFAYEKRVNLQITPDCSERLLILGDYRKSCRFHQRQLWKFSFHDSWRYLGCDVSPLVGNTHNIYLVTRKKPFWKVNTMLLKDENILAIGMISMAFGILIGRFLHFEYAGFSLTDFTEGILTGLSMTLNLTYLIRKRKQ